MNDQKPIESTNHDVSKKETSDELVENDLKQVAGGGEDFNMKKDVDKPTPKL